MEIFFRKIYPIPEDVQKKDVYYLIDWDFREHKEKRVPCRKELLKLLNIKSMGEITSTTSVIPVENLELAMQVRDVLVKYGAVVKVRECRGI